MKILTEKKNSYARILYAIRFVILREFLTLPQKTTTSPYSNMKSYHIYQHIRYVTHREMGNFPRIIFWKKIVFTHSLEVSLKVVLYAENHVVHIRTIYGH